MNDTDAVLLVAAADAHAQATLIVPGQSLAIVGVVRLRAKLGADGTVREPAARPPPERSG